MKLAWGSYMSSFGKTAFPKIVALIQTMIALLLLAI